MQTQQRIGDRAQGRWRGILPALGVPERFLTGKHQPCPICGGKDRARFDNREMKGTWICGKCGAGDGFKLVMLMHGWDFKQAAREVEKLLGVVPKDEPATVHIDTWDKRAALNKLWRSAGPVTADDLAGRYLTARCGVTAYPSCLRYVPYLRYQDTVPTYHPAMVAMVTGPDGRPVTLHRTYLGMDGKKAEVEAPRRLMPGPVVKAAAVRLAEVVDEMAIAEGIETALSVTALFGVPCWAVLSAAMLAQWHPPKGTKRVLICGDNDQSYTGQAAAYELARRLVSTVSVEVQIPHAVGVNWDWNDAHLMLRTT